MKELIRLIHIANKLDNRGFTKMADALDKVIRKMAQPYPHDEDWEAMEPSIEELEAIEQEVGEEGGLEAGPEEVTDEELKMQLEAFRGLLDDDRLSPEDKKRVHSALEEIKVDLGEVGGAAWGGEMTPGELETSSVDLPIAEAFKV